MKWIKTLVVVSLVATGLPATGFAQGENKRSVMGFAQVEIEGPAEGPYEEQLSAYPKFYSDYTEGIKADTDKKKEATAKLKLTRQRLQEQYDFLTGDIKEREGVITQLQDMNVKIANNQAALQQQFVELEGRYDQQKAENDKLRSDLEVSKEQFYQKMIEFYEKEAAILGDQTTTLEERQQSIKDNILKLKENLEAERQDAAASMDMEEAEMKDSENEYFDGEEMDLSEELKEGE
ncbi:MAG TPA: hypothetical protein VLJ10_02745 [Candidatus Bathyarchaeia archaeon]|nr:hypothetical protein [Candidatus Bathyarchaeia archaeon]